MSGDLLSLAAAPRAPRSRSRVAEVGLEKLWLFPDKLAALQRCGEGLCDFSYPVSVELSLSNRCNQNCLWCSDEQLRQRCPDKMNLDILGRLFEDLASGGSRGVTIEGGGEPSIWPWFAQAVELAVTKRLAVGLISNGLDLFAPHIPAGLYGRFEWVRVSLDAANRQQYLQLKGVNGFEKVLASIARLCRDFPHLTVGVGYVLTNANDEPQALAELSATLARLGVSYLHLRPVVNHPELLSSAKADFLRAYETETFSINSAALEENGSHGNDNLPCLAHSLSAVIGADTAVWLCGRLNSGEKSLPPLGYLAEESFGQIWRGPERLRQSALVAEAGFCQTHCPVCRMSKYNRLLADLARLRTRHFI